MKRGLIELRKEMEESPQKQTLYQKTPREENPKGEL